MWSTAPQEAGGCLHGSGKSLRGKISAALEVLLVEARAYQRAGTLQHSCVTNATGLWELGKIGLADQVLRSLARAAEP